MEMAELKRKQNEKPADRQKMMDEALKEVKDRKKKIMDLKFAKKQQEKPKAQQKQAKKGRGKR